MTARPRRPCCARSLLVLGAFALSALSALSANEASAQSGAPEEQQEATSSPDAQRSAAPAPSAAPSAARPARVFSNGPRDVPTPRGRDLARLRRLGLGTGPVARQLLWGRPDARWVQAAPGRVPRTLLWPVVNGPLWQGFRSMGGRHRALDIGGHCGTPIRAAHAGLVAYSDNGMQGMGNVVVLVHPGGWVTAYGHARKTLVPAGSIVRRGQPIALVGDTGVAYGCHVHFIAYHNGTRLDPQRMMAGAPTSPARARRPTTRSPGASR